MLWDDRNRRYVTIDHPHSDHPERAITVRELEETLFDPERIEGNDPQHCTRFLIGTTQAGRLLFVAYSRRRGGRFPIHAHQRRRPMP